MARTLLVVAAAALVLAGCGGEPPPARPSSASVTPPPSPTPSVSSEPTGTQSPTSSPSPSLEPDEDVRLPPNAPTAFDEAVGAADLTPGRLAPRGARIGSAWRSPDGAAVQALAFAWSRGADPLASESGFEVWTRFETAPAWRVVYAFTDRASAGVLGVTFEDGDLTDDGVPDALTFESTGGSGGCGTWRVVEIRPGDASEIWSRQTCDTQVRILGGDLAVREAVFAPGDAHCCPSAYRTTTLRWTGDRWKIASRRTRAA
jgi:hypothetical protein